MAASSKTVLTVHKVVRAVPPQVQLTAGFWNVSNDLFHHEIVIVIKNTHLKIIDIKDIHIYIAKQYTALYKRALLHVDQECGSVPIGPRGPSL